MNVSCRLGPRRTQLKCLARSIASQQQGQQLKGARSILQMASKKRLALTLRKLPPFINLPEAEMVALVEAGQASDALSNQIIIAKGQPINGLTLLLEGKTLNEQFCFE